MTPRICYLNDPKDIKVLAGQGLFYNRLSQVIREQVPIYYPFWIYKADPRDKDLKLVVVHDKYNRPNIVHSFYMGDVVFDTLNQFLTKTFKD